MLPTHGRYEFRPITQRPDFRWPDGNGLALYVAFGVEEYCFGEGMTEDLMPGASKPDMVNTSWRDYGNRVGGFRLIDRFASRGIRPAMLLNTEVYDHAPALMDAAHEAGIEMVGHGLTNSDTLAGMSLQAELAYMKAVQAKITEKQGFPARGWSSPWLAHTENTIDLLPEAGFSYLLDLRMDDQPVHLKSKGGSLLALPYALELNDSTTMIGRQTTARDFAQMIVDEFDEMRIAARSQPLVMSIVVHSFISGQPFRLASLTAALDHIVSHRDEVWLAQPGEIEAFVRGDSRRLI
ncbi:polysaccharide deacetylase [Metarhizobium album]|uniref:Polysaccharide deacetylase n=1 Tax=Metarhizobium album TaxID=2182425 RepID=A0A2U2DFY1_9HYPH|nr:polysaccharide deacetylase family protein [Rhizobium album]PWE52200.1 polysaccharide deacetylase [Rhizobium album]